MHLVPVTLGVHSPFSWHCTLWTPIKNCRLRHLSKQTESVLFLLVQSEIKSSLLRSGHVTEK